MNRTTQNHTMQQPTVPHHAELRAALAAYRNGLTADILQARINGEWGPIWTIPVCSCDSMERAGRQFTWSRAEAVRYTRHARLRRPSTLTAMDVVVMSEIPSREQSVIGFDGVILRVDGFLTDAAFDALETSFSPTPRP